MKEVAKSAGFKLNSIMPALFSFRDNQGKIVALLSSNVDDFLYGYLPEGKEAMDKLINAFQVGKEESGEFRFCGKEVVQHADYSIKVTAHDNLEKIQPITYDHKRKLVSRCTDEENTQLRSVTAAIAWVARQCRPGLSYKVSKLQTKGGNGTVFDMRECNKLLDLAKRTADQGIYFSSNGPSWGNQM